MSAENSADGSEKKPKNTYLEARKTEKEKRFDFVFERYIKGMRYMEIVKAYVAQFQESERTAKKYIERVNKHLANPAPQERDKKLNKALATYEYLFSNLVAQGKYKEAGDIRAKMDRLEGLDRIIIDQNVNVNKDEPDFSNMSLEDLLRLQQLLTGTSIDASTIIPSNDQEEARDVDYEEVEQNPADDE